MYKTWDLIVQENPDTWVVLVDAEFGDPYHMHLLGGVIFCTASDQKDMMDKIPIDDDRAFVCRHTNEEVEEDGALKSVM